MTILDISMVVSAEMPAWPGTTVPSVEWEMLLTRGDIADVSRWTIGAHSGTHVDAPSHFLAGAPGLDGIPLDALVGRARVVDIPDTVATIGRADVAALRIDGVERILFRTSNSRLRLAKFTFDESYVGLEPEAASELVDAGVRLIGIDYLSIEPFGRDAFPAHRILLGCPGGRLPTIGAAPPARWRRGRARPRDPRAPDRMMRAVRWHARGDVRVDNVPEARAPSVGEVRLRVDWCGICGTDREEWRAGPLFIPSLVPHPLTGTLAPITLGHEVAATVVDVGSGVTTVREGQLVALDGLITCGTCWWCGRHEVTLCPDLASIGLHIDGGLAEYMTVAAQMALPVPSGVDPQTAALAEPLSVAVRAVRKGRFVPGESVLVLGAGMIGLAAMRVALAMGAASVTVAAPSELRRQQALRLGASAVVDPTVPEFLDDVRRLHSGRGPDLVIEAAGTLQAAEQAIPVARRGGRVVLVGLPSMRGMIDFFQLVATERELIGSLSHVWDEDFAAAVRLLEGGILRAEDVVAARIPLERTVDQGFDSMSRKDLPGVKILVSPWI